MSDERTIVTGSLILDDRVVTGRLTVANGRIVEVVLDEDADHGAGRGDVGGGDVGGGTLRAGPYIAPGFVDVHVHGWGDHDAMGPIGDLDGMARVLLRHGVTSFLPTAVTASLADLVEFAERVRSWLTKAPSDGAAPLGFNLEGPFLAQARKGAHDPTHLRLPADVAWADLQPLLDGLRLITVAPELPGALALIASLRERGIAVSMGHSAADLAEARAGYSAGGTTTTHLFNAMTGVDHRAPGLAVAALADDAVYVELIADGQHVHPGLWPLITRLKPIDRLLLVSDAIALAGMGDGRSTVGGLDVEVVGGRVTLTGTSTLAGSVIALDDAVRNVVDAGVALPAAVAAASRNPLAMLGVTDRGRLAIGQRADLVELDDDLRVARVMREGRWQATTSPA